MSVDDVAGNGLGRYHSPRHWMPFDSRKEGSTCVSESMTWRAISAWPYPCNFCVEATASALLTATLRAMSGGLAAAAAAAACLFSAMAVAAAVTAAALVLRLVAFAAAAALVFVIGGSGGVGVDPPATCSDPGPAPTPLPLRGTKIYYPPHH